MKGVKLMDRSDSKFIANSFKITEFLSEAASSYHVQESWGIRMFSYRTIYFDTPDYKIYITHHDGRKVRQKIRIRTYVESQLTFLEIKSKDNKSKTHKFRIRLSGEELNEEGKRFIDEKSSYAPSELSPCLDITFKRITLVNNDENERLTIDNDLLFKNFHTGKVRRLDDIAVIESKTSGNVESTARPIFLDLRIKPMNFSKYCIGCVLTDSSLKRNLFNEKLRYLDKLTNNRYEYAY
ncbi:MAG: polyphosphate polymerase domain-containing protein [Bacteroidales bacterium]|nr:polyphosphate polymerase domain-containing protein [Bacteroidales bacterium]MCI2146164.1 polyphosphate polymerase domain-containing protein [Bacteroidales bacterium]